MKNIRKNESVRTVVFDEMRKDAKWGTRSLVEEDPIWNYNAFIDEVNNWSFERMLDGLDLEYNGEGYAPAA